MQKKTALLVIDVQVAMFSYENMELYKGEEVLNNICLLIKEARAKDVPVVFIQHTADEEYEKDTATWQLHPKLTPLINESVVEKTTCDSFYNTKLAEVLDKLEVNKLIIMGMQTQFCVDTTCRSAFGKGYENILIKDAHSTFDGEMLNAEKTIEYHNSIIDGRFAKLISTKDGLDYIANLK